MRSVRTESEPLASYFLAARSLPRLDRRREHALALRASRGDATARDELVRRNLSLVLGVVRTQTLGAVPLEDVVQEGSLGLMRAAEKFDPHAGTRFSTYAVWWIRAYVTKYLRQARSSVRPRSGDVAQHDVSLDANAHADGDTTYLDLLADDRPGPESVLTGTQADGRVRTALARARPRLGRLGWDIVLNRLQRDDPDTLEEIGRRWGLSRERVRQVEVRTREFLHRYLTETCRLPLDAPLRAAVPSAPATPARVRVARKSTAAAPRARKRPQRGARLARRDAPRRRRTASSTSPRLRRTCSGR